ncbi:MAG TPA: hypothetical protein VM580_22870, partial [Labilithrix sp.]|nr:hypothetical protein [Labilithrix sp.]
MTKGAAARGEGMKDDYVPIVRHFRDTSQDPHPAAERRLLRDLRPEDAETWSSLVAPGDATALVLLAASGTGKTTELTELVASLRARSQHAVWSDARSIVAEGFESSLTAENARAFSVWRAGTAHAVVVVDAVDEIHLDGRTMRDLARRLERGLDLGTRSVQLVLGVRNGAWSADYTWQLTNLLRQGTKAPKVRVVRFEPI